MIAETVPAAKAGPRPATFRSHRVRVWPWVPILAVALVLVVAASLAWGAVRLTPAELWAALWRSPDARATDVSILWNLRLPRTLLAAVVGGALAVAGAAFQGLFRNPLADPYVIGASSGAALGATLAVSFGFSATVLGLGPVPIAAFIGALTTVAVVYAVAESSGETSVAGLLLAGTALGSMFASVVSFLLIWREQPWFQVFGWLLGGFSGRSWTHLGVVLPYALLGGGVLWAMARPLDALAGGDDLARSLGLPLRRTRLVLVGASGLIVAAAVATSGIIGFVGLIAPHAARWLFGAGHAKLIPASAVLGALLLVIADVVARTVLAPAEVPVGVITGLLGGPFFLYLLKTRGSRNR